MKKKICIRFRYVLLLFIKTSFKKIRNHESILFCEEKLSLFYFCEEKLSVFYFCEEKPSVTTFITTFIYYIDLNWIVAPNKSSHYYLFGPWRVNQISSSSRNKQQIITSLSFSHYNAYCDYIILCFENTLEVSFLQYFNKSVLHIHDLLVEKS